MDLALSNLEGLICHKILPTITHTHTLVGLRIRRLHFLQSYFTHKKAVFSISSLFRCTIYSSYNDIPFDCNPLSELIANLYGRNFNTCFTVITFITPSKHLFVLICFAFFRGQNNMTPNYTGVIMHNFGSSGKYGVNFILPLLLGLHWPNKVECACVMCIGQVNRFGNNNHHM